MSRRAIRMRSSYLCLSSDYEYLSWRLSVRTPRRTCLNTNSQHRSAKHVRTFPVGHAYTLEHARIIAKAGAVTCSREQLCSKHEHGDVQY